MELYLFEPAILMEKTCDNIHKEYTKALSSQVTPKKEIENIPPQEQDEQKKIIVFEEPAKKTTLKIKTRPELKETPAAEDQKTDLPSTSHGRAHIIEIDDQQYFKLSNLNNTYYHHDTSTKQIEKVIGRSKASDAAQIIEDTLTEHPLVRPWNTKSKGLKYNKASLKDITFKFTDSLMGSTRIVTKFRLPTVEEEKNLGKNIEILSPKGYLKK